MKHLTFVFSLVLSSLFVWTNSTAQVHESLVKDLNKPKLELAVLVSPCIGGGYNLLVYNPFAKSALSFSSADYDVKWVYANGNIFLTDKIVLPCVCNGSFKAIVTHLPTGRQKSITIYIPPCDMVAAG